MLALLKKARPIVLAMLAVYLVSFGAGFAAGKLKWVDAGRLRGSKLATFNRSLEYKIPVYGPLLQKYKNWERPRMMKALFQGKVVRAMFLIFFNNWIVADATMIVRAALLAPMILYPYGRFVQGAGLAQTPSPSQLWIVLMTEFGGYFLMITATLVVVLWSLFFRRFGFASRRRAFGGGMKLFLAAFLVAGVFFFVGSYAETMSVLGMSVR
jgi:hypothetical protein